MSAQKVLRAVLVLTLTAAFAALFLGVFAAPPSPPGRINYQGVLRDSAGAPLDGLQTMTFRFYDDPTAGTVLWEETYSPAYPPQVTVSGGLFTLALGDAAHRTAGIEPLFPGVFSNNTPIYLAVAVGLDAEMTPRIQVVSAPYALNCDTLDGIESSMFAKFAGPGTITANWVNTAFPWADNEVSDTLTLGAGSTIDSSIAVGNANTLDTFDSSYFLNTSATDQTKAGKLTLNSAAGYGIDASGPTAGGYFHDSNSIAYAQVGTDGSGIIARGTLVGGYFKDYDNSGYANVGYGEEGIHAEGNTAGGYFKDLNGTGYANVGYGDVGIDGSGDLAGGYFHSSVGAGYGYAWVGYLYSGIEARGTDSGGFFVDSNGSGYGYVGRADTGGEFYGNGAGVYAADSDSGGIGRVGYGTFSFSGTGSKSFVQNHPTQKDKVIVYTCLEGDEVATYTRGTAKLVNGEARVKLGETFQWVTNPDIGLTANLTPHGRGADLYVDSLSTSELVVKCDDPKASDVAFDFLVYGLRIGFEESSIVQEKQEESFIPSFKDHRERYAKFPELRAFNSLERFKTMESSVRGVPAVSIDLSRAKALKDAVHEYDPATDPPVEELFGHGPGRQAHDMPPASGRLAQSAYAAPVNAERPPAGASFVDPSRGGVDPAIAVAPEPHFPCLPVSGAVEVGDVVVMDRLHNGSFILCNMAADPLVVGIAAGGQEACRSQQQKGDAMSVARVPIATSGIVACKVDAGFGPIRLGDLLVASPIQGHAMRTDNPAQGTVLGKALEPLDAGTGIIKVIIMLR